MTHMAGWGAPTTERDFKRKLKDLLAARRLPGGGTRWRLDLRPKGLRGSRLVVRDPDAEGWPDRGPGTDDRRTAERWVDAYVERLGIPWLRGRGKERTTIREWLPSYVSWLKNHKGSDSHTFKQYRNDLHNRVVPVLGDERLRSISPKRVQSFIDGLRREDGDPLAKSTIDVVLSAMSGLFQHAYPHALVPWHRKIKVRVEDGNRKRRKEAKKGDAPHLNRGYTDAECLRTLKAAEAIDREFRDDPRKARGIPDHAHVIAFLLAHPVRIHELAYVRAHDFDETLGAIYIRGTKSGTSQRYIPVQQSYLPWFKRLIKGKPDDALVFATNRKGTCSVSTLRGKVERVTDRAGTRVPDDLTHVFRKTFMSRAFVADLDLEVVGVLSGHKLESDRLFQDHYLAWASLIQKMPDHFTDLVELPLPPEDRE